MPLQTNPIPKPPIPPLSADTALARPPVPAIERIKLFGPTAWEEFILEWVDSLRDQYSRVERYGGAGDMGIDIIAERSDGSWDNYQCKHYDKPLIPSLALRELGKFIYHCFKGEFSYPRAYLFVAPQGAGTTLAKLLKRPEELRSELIDKWDVYCRDTITSRNPVLLEGEFADFVQALDFSIFDAVPPLRIIHGHSATPWHSARFGGLPERPPIRQPPPALEEGEAIFARELLAAYSDYTKATLNAPSDLGPFPSLRDHFIDSRVEFYSAESLRAFSRDTLPPGAFERLQDQIHSGIRDELRDEHPHGYARVIAVIRMARILGLSDHALLPRMSVRDRGGLCHHLVNEEVFRWVP